MSKVPFVLLVNPWITDFAAFDLWAKPYGLLSLAALLREGGYGVAVVDCLDRHEEGARHHHQETAARDRAFGTGHYQRIAIAKPAAYADVPRRFYRYGIPPDRLLAKLAAMPRPDLVWVTSMMTYWYPGVVESIAVIREVFPEVPIWLGGIYARLCPDHARRSTGATEVVTLPLPDLFHKTSAALGRELKNRAQWQSFTHASGPALDLLSMPLPYAPLLTSVGCPLRCPYCASGILQPVWERRSAETIVAEIARWHLGQGVEDFAFYDDALLLDADRTLKPALDQVCRAGWRLRFHTPNALHVRAITRQWSDLLCESGFATLRLGLETASPQRQEQWGGKLAPEMFLAAVQRLLRSGFAPTQIGAYLLCGVPGQKPSEVAEAIEWVRQAGVQAHLAEYSPVPGTAMWAEAVAASKFDLRREPLYHNNTFFALRRPDFSFEDLETLKRLARATRAPGLGS